MARIFTCQTLESYRIVIIITKAKATRTRRSNRIAIKQGKETTDLTSLSEKTSDATICEQTSRHVRSMQGVRTWCSKYFHFFMFLSCHINYNNITRIAHSHCKKITRKSMLECTLDYMTKTQTPTLEHRYRWDLK
jgi:hypothetical protein